MSSPTMTLITSQTLASSSSSVTFSSIPQTFNNLIVKTSVRSDANDTSYKWTFNGSSTGYYSRNLYTYVAAPSSYNVGSYSQSNASYLDIDAIVVSVYTGNIFNNAEMYIPNYTSSNYKSFSCESLAENNAGQNPMWVVGGLWQNTAAITSITFTTNGNNFVTNSTFYLYGISNS